MVWDIILDFCKQLSDYRPERFKLSRNLPLERRNYVWEAIPDDLNKPSIKIEDWLQHDNTYIVARDRLKWNCIKVRGYACYLFIRDDAYFLPLNGPYEIYVSPHEEGEEHVIPLSHEQIKAFEDLKAKFEDLRDPDYCTVK
jgi:hypothetical protein